MIIEKNTYNQYISLDSSNNILYSFTDGVALPGVGDIEIGTTQDRHWAVENYLTENVIPCKKFIDGEIVDRDESEINVIRQDRETTNWFRESDLDFIRVVEDIIDALISKNTIKLKDLPENSENKYNTRKAKRNEQ